MADNQNNRSAALPRRGPVPLSDLVGKAIGPLTAKRGIAAADLAAAWPGIVGTRFADCTRPEKIAWPKGGESEWRQAVLVVRVDGPRAVFFQHEVGQVIERVNSYLGYAAVGRIRIVQAPVTPRPGAEDRTAPALTATEEARLDEALAGLDDDPLREALAKLGRGVLSDRQR